MRYRAVQKSDGLFYLEYRVFLFWWCESAFGPFVAYGDAIAHRERNNAKLPPRPRVVRVLP